MRQVTTEALKGPDAPLDPEVVAFRAQFGETSPLDELVRTGAQRMLQNAAWAESYHSRIRLYRTIFGRPR